MFIVVLFYVFILIYRLFSCGFFLIMLFYVFILIYSLFSCGLFLIMLFNIFILIHSLFPRGLFLIMLIISFPYFFILNLINLIRTSDPLTFSLRLIITNHPLRCPFRLILFTRFLIFDCFKGCNNISKYLLISLSYCTNILINISFHLDYLINFVEDCLS